MQEITLAMSFVILSLSIILAIFAFIEMLRKEWIEFFWLSSKASLLLGIYQIDLNEKVAPLCFLMSFVLFICQEIVRKKNIDRAIAHVEEQEKKFDLEERCRL